MITRKAYAKINLALDVLGKYPNGYHEVKMVMQTIDLYDVLKFEEFVWDPSELSSVGISELQGKDALEAKQDEAELTARIKIVGVNCAELSLGTDNLIFKAAAKLLTYIPSDKGVRISLEKNIPVAAGMAGGSTDCAATLHGINELFDLKLTDEQLCEIGVKLGADVPYCIMGGTMLAEGIGEKLTKLPDAPELMLVVAKPEMGVSTKFVYEHLDAYVNPPHPDVEGMIKAIEEADKDGVASKLGNILEIVTVPACPEVAMIKDILANNGADGVLMSGSGPTVFSIFSDENKAREAVEILKKDSPAKFVCLTKICGGKQ